MNNVEEGLLEELRETMDAERFQAAYDRAFHSSKYLVLYGSGAVGTKVFFYCYNAGIKVDFFCESPGGKHIGQDVCGVKCISFEELLAIRGDVSVIITNGDALNTYRCLCSNGFINIHCINHVHTQIFNYIKSVRFPDIEEKIKQLRSILFDDLSFAIVMDILIGTFKFDFSVERISRLYSPNQYFPKDIIYLTDNEYFLDAGAFDGDTIKTFAKLVGGWRAIYAFEPSENNCNALRSNTTLLSNVNVYQMGLSEFHGKIQYFENHSATSIDLNKGEKTAEVVRLDDILRDKPITFIKMDIEGAEVSALKGAEHIIRTQKPKCAISVYHHPEHIFEVPFLLKKYVSEYKLFFRHHTQLLSETMCYAIL